MKKAVGNKMIRLILAAAVIAGMSCTLFPENPADSTVDVNFTIVPASGTLEATFVVAVEETGEDQTLEVRWDWENDGEWDTPWSDALRDSHNYESTGEKVIRMEVHDRDGSAETVVRSLWVSAWKEIAPLHYARRTAAAVPFSGKIYVFGGEDELGNISRYVERYEPDSDSWGFMGFMPNPRCFHGSVVLDDAIYIIGGRTRSDYYTNVDVYYPGSNTWTEKAPLLFPASSMSAHLVNGKIYAVGSGVEPDRMGMFVQEYDPDTDLWVEKDSTRWRIGDLASVVYNGEIYLTDGIYALIYNPESDAWRTDSRRPAGFDYDDNGIPEPVGIVGSKIYLISDPVWYDPDIRPATAVFDLAAFTYAQKGNMMRYRSNFAACILGDRIYAIGGGTSDYFYSTLVEEYLIH